MPSSRLTVDGTVQAYSLKLQPELSVGGSRGIFGVGTGLLAPYQTRCLSLTSPTLLRHSLYRVMLTQYFKKINYPVIF
jgi:hypothetical protein